jgi:hypothetical protein
MSELSSLEALLVELRKHMDETGDRISLIPKYFIVRPEDLEALGLTVDDVQTMIAKIKSRGDKHDNN